MKITFGRITNKIKSIKFIDIRKCYQYHEAYVLRSLFDKYGINAVVDIGANEGQFADFIRKKVGYSGFMISFEPLPNAFSILQEKSKSDPNWYIDQIAISDQSGNCEFNVTSGSEFSSLSQPLSEFAPMFSGQNSITEKIMVRCETLNEAGSRYNLHQQGRDVLFLKLDTQGKDYDIVKGHEDFLTKCAIVQTEASIKKIYSTSVDFTEVANFYRNLGFSITAIEPANVGQFPDMIECNFIFHNPAFSQKTSNELDFKTSQNEF